MEEKKLKKIQINHFEKVGGNWHSTLLGQEYTKKIKQQRADCIIK